ncbi:MAG: rhodanese-like domain-containing protein [Sandaracinaceae bacterium]|nr:rhodanese-like domain-containing protein [Sandaracinaceae bacterium]
MRAALYTLVAVSVGCQSGAPGVSRARARRDDGADVHLDALHFETSPGGAPEVDVAWLRAYAGRVRLVDVREEPEIRASGSIDGAEHVPLAELAEAASDWPRDAPVVVVCRSGRRSARAVATLEQLGLTRAASLTGGVLSWQQAGAPLVPIPTRRAAPTPTLPAGPLSSARLEEALRLAPPRSVRAAALLLHGTESCIDGREGHAVLGTPGGDAGELLLALATIEALVSERRGAPFELDAAAHGPGSIPALFDAYVASFGRVYFHTDEEALRRLGDALDADPRFAALVRDADVEGIEALVRHPPVALRDALLEHLLEPAHVGCGHLRLVLTRPDEYGVRPALWRAVAGQLYRALFTRPELVDFVILVGEHHEEAIVEVRLEDDVHAFTNVPAIPPSLGGHSVFVSHPQVAAFVRGQHARFLFHEVPALRAHGVTPEALETELHARAARQLEATLGHLAVDLPVFELRVERDGTSVVARRGGA